MHRQRLLDKEEHPSKSPLVDRAIQHVTSTVPIRTVPRQEFASKETFRHHVSLHSIHRTAIPEGHFHIDLASTATDNRIETIASQLAFESIKVMREHRKILLDLLCSSFESPFSFETLDKLDFRTA